MNIQIKSRWDDSVLFEGDFPSIKAALAAAAARRVSLSGADLRKADLRNADLRNAVLRNAVLSGADLSGAVLSGADLSGAVLRNAVLRNADLSGAVLRNADLRNADLRNAVLRNADLRNADLRNADLRNAVLRNAVLRNAVLSGAVLSGAVLSDAMIKRIVAQTTILPEGDLVGYKKLAAGKIAVLKIPAEALRVGGTIGRKCRADCAIVLKGNGISRYDFGFEYKQGETVKPREAFDPNPLVECASGIHFFITEQEAKDF